MLVLNGVQDLPSFLEKIVAPLSRLLGAVLRDRNLCSEHQKASAGRIRVNMSRDKNLKAPIGKQPGKTKLTQLRCPWDPQLTSLRPWWWQA